MIVFALAAALSFIPQEAEPLFGFGLVIGLRGTGGCDPLTNQCTAQVLERYGVPRFAAGPLGRALAECRVVAVVVVTAQMSGRPGGIGEVVVSPIDDASSLKGGLLLLTPLRRADGKVCAVAKGPLTSHAGKVATVVDVTTFPVK